MLDEFGLIRRLAERIPTAHQDVTLGIGDDAAVLAYRAADEVVVTTDTMVEGSHFLPETMSAADIGYKSVAASISDIAAMGGVPRHVLVAIGIPLTMPVEDLDNVYDGIRAICERCQCVVVGGDVVHTDGPMFINTTVLGSVESGRALRRSGAQPGDVVFVTGEVGTAQAGLRDLIGAHAHLQTRLAAASDAPSAADAVPSGSLADVARHVSSIAPRALGTDDQQVVWRAHQRPIPQVDAGQILNAEQASSCNDISDGLASELNEIAAASGVRLRIDERRIPIHAATRNVARLRGEDATAYAWYGGEDYQLVGTATPFAFARILARCESIGVKVTQIGRVEAGDGVVADLIRGGLDIISSKGYNHFSKSTDGTTVKCQEGFDGQPDVHHDEVRD